MAEEEPSGGLLAALPATAGGQAADRVRCFLLGARVHDHVSDLVRAYEELDEAKADSQLEFGAEQWMGALEHDLKYELDEANEIGCVPGGIADLYNAYRGAAGRAARRDAVYALTVRLGDPPLLRNLRRYAGSQPPAGSKR
ncbi:MAG: hypothetical protein ACREB9_08725 [Thermoplasmata archaeon]